MKQITGSEALQILSQNGAQCLIAMDTLGYLVNNKADFSCYGDGICVIFVDHSGEMDHITVVPFQNSFDYNALKNILCQCKGDFDLWIDTQKLSQSFLTSLDLEGDGFLEYERTVEDLLYPQNQSPDGVSTHIRLLEQDDMESFTRFSSEHIVNRPPLSVLFDVFITREQGFILAAFEEGMMVGYLSFFQMLPEVLDVDYIYVEPPKRGRGIGKALGNAYIKYALDRNRSAYWSNAQNDASKATALSCGFQVIRQSKKYIKGQLRVI